MIPDGDTLHTPNFHQPEKYNPNLTEDKYEKKKMHTKEVWCQEK